MLREITIGQYYPTDSFIHKLDPRVKLAGTLLYVISLFLSDSLEVYVFISFCLFMIIKISQVSFKFVLRGLKPVLFIIIFTAVFNLFLTPGADVLLRVGFLKITVAGAKKTLLVIVRFIYLIIGSSLMTYTTTPNQLTDGLEKALKPLNKIKVPVHEMALMMSLALRFIPVLMEETDKLIKAQSARGADFEEGNFFVRAKNMISIIIPLFASANRRADDLAYAMDSRCYNGGVGRTKYKPLRYGKNDAIGYACVLCYLAVVIVLGKCDVAGLINGLFG